ncbi:MAG TPA: glycosyltransferase family 1 protein [Gemmatimonadales bacterium]|nr:glycosyltransferase family 1 protein [Gemmatimonadales bacterium]
MRIAVFSEVYWPMVSGVGVTLLRLTEALEARGHQVRVYSATYPLPPSGDRPEARRSPSVPLFLYPDVQWAFPRLREIVDDLAAFRPDVVHVATEFALGLAGVKAARQLRVPVIASAHTDYQKYAARYGVEWVLRAGWHYLRWFYGHARRVLVPSRVYERYLHARGVHHTGLWTRGVDRTVFNPSFRSEEYRRSLGVGPDDLLVTYIGRIAREKDLELLVRAWRELGPVRKGAQLVLVGRGPLEDELRSAGIPGLHVIGLRQGRELSVAYASADVFAFPSPTETFGNSLLEAMASGLPSLAAEAGGVLDFAVQGVNALLVPPGDLGAIRTGLARLLQDVELRHRLAAGGLRTASERPWGAIYDRLLDDYREAAGRREVERAA